MGPAQPDPDEHNVTAPKLAGGKMKWLKKISAYTLSLHKNV